MSKEQNENKKYTIHFEEKLQVGDEVIVVGPYAGGSNQTEEHNHRARGWTRYVTRILEGRNYPILFGTREGEPTGWARASSLKVVKRASNQTLAAESPAPTENK